MKIIRVGVDLAKNVFQTHGVDRNEKPVWRKHLKRTQWIHALTQAVEPGAEVGMEACAGAHHRLLVAVNPMNLKDVLCRLGQINQASGLGLNDQDATR